MKYCILNNLEGEKTPSLLYMYFIQVADIMGGDV